MRSLKNILTFELLYDLHVTKGKSTREISKELGVGVHNIETYLNNYGIFNKKRDTTLRKAVNVSEILSYEYLKSVHKEKEVKEIAEETGCGNSTVRKYLHKYGLEIKNSRVGKTAGEKNPSWKGGRYKNHFGYVMVRVAKGVYAREHVLVVENHLGRKLYRDEVVHHLNGKADDNVIDNLMVLTKKEHDNYHAICRKERIDYTKHSKEDVLSILEEYS